MEATIAYSYAKTVASGSTDPLAVPFEYLDRAHVHVDLNGVRVVDGTLTWTSSGQVRLPSAPVAGTLVKVYRLTTALTPAVAFGLGDLDPVDLNVQTKQTLYLAQEAYDLAVDDLGLEWGGQFYARGLRVTAAADAQADGDLVTFRQLKAYQKWDWLLATGSWNDSGVWDDSMDWID